MNRLRSLYILYNRSLIITPKLYNIHSVRSYMTYSNIDKSILNKEKDKCRIHHPLGWLGISQSYLENSPEAKDILSKYSNRVDGLQESMLILIKIYKIRLLIFFLFFYFFVSFYIF